MNPLTCPIIIKLEPDWFKSGYYIYVVSIKYNGKTYFYVGMTGDRNHLTARSPFYRMSGHFMQGNSTQNQIIKGIEKKFGVKATPELLCQMHFTYYAWLLNTFIDGDVENHKIKRQYGEEVETALISMLRSKYGPDALFNARISRKLEGRSDEIAQQIVDYLAQN